MKAPVTRRQSLLVSCAFLLVISVSHLKGSIYQDAKAKILEKQPSENWSPPPRLAPSMPTPPPHLPSTMPSTLPAKKTRRPYSIFNDLDDEHNVICLWDPNSRSRSCLSELQVLREQPQQRVLFFGDSTMRYLFSRDSLTHPLINSCFGGHLVEQEDRCHNETSPYDDYARSPAHPWTPPGRMEGPSWYGLDNPRCSDCRECLTQAIFLEDATTADRRDCLQYGGYFAVEFARDVVIQSTQYRTTQENTLHFVHVHYTPAQENICVVSAGQHDVGIPGITPEAFGENVEWYLSLIRNECRAVVWISNTAPASDYTEWPQGREILRRMDQAVVRQAGHLIDVFLDVFIASMDFPHMDNIHMSLDWYELLSQLFHDALLV